MKPRAPKPASARVSRRLGSAADLVPHIDWTPFFRAWELAGNYPAILEDASCGRKRASCSPTRSKMLDQIVARSG
jgi:5-methyltetrahydrofolate--homocysteine methyltransferase